MRKCLVSICLVFAFLLSACGGGGGGNNPLGQEDKMTPAPAIIDFTPTSGIIGTQVVVSGSNFQPEKSENLVFLNGTPAQVTEATNTQLTIIVPSGASTGPISVTTLNGSSSTAINFTVTTSLITNWTKRVSETPSLKTIAWSGSTYAGFGGFWKEAYTSPDGTRWKAANVSIFMPTARQVIWDGARFLAVCDQGELYASINGSNWTRIYSHDTHYSFDSIAVADDRMVIVGSGNFILISMDGIHWIEQEVNTTYGLKKVIWTGDQFLAVGPQGMILSSPDGIQWETQNSPAVYLNSVALAQGGYVAIGNGILTSDDGRDWSKVVNSVTDGSWEAIASSGEIFVVVGEQNQRIITSSDGLNWVEASLPLESMWSNVIWTGSKFVAVGWDGIIQSSDGVNWQISGVNDNIIGMVQTGGRYLALTSEGFLLSSDDQFQSWSWRKAIDLPAGEKIFALAGSEDRLVAVGGGFILSSADGLSWEYHHSFPNLFGVTWTGSEFLLVGDHALFVSVDGLDWHPQTLPGTFYAAALCGGNYILAGNEGKILTSPDGIIWTQQNSGSQQPLLSIACSSNRIVAVGAEGTILSSPDGVAWTKRFSGVWWSILGVGWAGNRFVAVDEYGYIRDSENGDSWTYPIDTGRRFYLDTVYYDGHTAWVLGGGGNILSQP